MGSILLATASTGPSQSGSILWLAAFIGVLVAGGLLFSFLVARTHSKHQGLPEGDCDELEKHRESWPGPPAAVFVPLLAQAEQLHKEPVGLVAKSVLVVVLVFAAALFFIDMYVGGKQERRISRCKGCNAKATITAYDENQSPLYGLCQRCAGQEDAGRRIRRS